MSTSSKPKSGPPAHQNRTAFRHNKNSKLTKKIAETVTTYGLCDRCRAKQEWRVKVSSSISVCPVSYCRIQFLTGIQMRYDTDSIASTNHYQYRGSATSVAKRPSKRLTEQYVNLVPLSIMYVQAVRNPWRDKSMMKIQLNSRLTMTTTPTPTATQSTHRTSDKTVRTRHRMMAMVPVHCSTKV